MDSEFHLLRRPSETAARTRPIGGGRLLVRATNWIGDSVMSLAALRELRRLHPGSRLTLLAKRWVSGLFGEQGLVDDIIVIENDQPSWRRVAEIRKRLRGFDTAVLFQNAFEAALMTFLARIPNRVGYRVQGRGMLLTRGARPRIKELKRHQVYYYLDLLYQTGLSPHDYVHDREFRPDIRLAPPAEGLEKALALLEEAATDLRRPLVGINPGAYFGSAKRWFPERYAAVADQLVAAGAEVVLMGAASDAETARIMAGAMRETPRILTGRTDLPALLGLISRCRFIITNDSGPMHLAAALQVPTIALFGSTDEQATGPFSSRAMVIHKHVECSPCLLRECPTDLRCFDRIEVGEVCSAAFNLLNRAE